MIVLGIGAALLAAAATAAISLLAARPTQEADHVRIF